LAVHREDFEQERRDRERCQARVNELEEMLRGEAVTGSRVTAGQLPALTHQSYPARPELNQPTVNRTHRHNAGQGRTAYVNGQFVPLGILYQFDGNDVTVDSQESTEPDGNTEKVFDDRAPQGAELGSGLTCPKCGKEFPTDENAVQRLLHHVDECL